MEVLQYEKWDGYSVIRPTFEDRSLLGKEALRLFYGETDNSVQN